MANAPSKLEPFREFIAAERRKGTTYRRIADLLAPQGVQVDYSTIHAFVKVRSKRPRKVITMWEPRDVPAAPAPQFSRAATEETHSAAAAPKPELSGQLDAIRRLKDSKTSKRRPDKGLPGFDENAPLDRLSEEEARRLRNDL